MYEFDWSGIPAALPTLGAGVVVTLKITSIAVTVGIVWGTLLAIFRLSVIKPLSWIAMVYVTFFRSIPLVMVLLWFFLIVPQVLQAVFNFPPNVDIRFISALIAFSLFEAAYYSEIIRAGIRSVSRGQIDAASALGMRYIQSMRLVVLPQALRAMLPLLLTQGIVLFQDTSLVYVIGLADFFRTASNIGDRDGRPIEMILFAGVSYFVICALASSLVACLGKKVAK